MPGVAAHTSSIMLASPPMMAAIVPGTASQQRCIAWARTETRRRPSSKERAPAATRAENSPSECPATMSGLIPAQIAVATECRNTAGCVTRVAFRSSAVPENMVSRRSKPRMLSAASKRSRACGSRT